MINTNPFLETDLQYSVNTAVTVAKLNSKYNYDRDFIFNYKAAQANLLGGESAGAATTILTIAAIEDMNLRNDVLMTGTINPDGTIGNVGGLLEKAKAVADSGFKYFLILKGQARMTYYERQITKETGEGFSIYNTRFVPKTIDLKKIARDEWNLNVIEVSNVKEALDYFIEK
mgnify:FL=1